MKTLTSSHLLAPSTSPSGILSLAAVWRRRIVTRAHLADIDPARLDDIGLTAEEAAAEARKPFWRA